jgi:hypothetical protein
MSGYTQTQTELLYSYGGAATTTTPTAAAVSITGTYPACEIPGQYFAFGGTPAKSLKLRMGGLLTATATVPTWIFLLALGTTNSYVGTPVLVTTATFTPTAASTNVPWFMDVDIVLRTLALGGGSTVGAFGRVTSSAFPSPFFVTLPATGTYTPYALYSADANVYLWPTLTLSAATAGNTVTTEFMKLYGEN